MKKTIRIGFGLGALFWAACSLAAVDISVSGLKTSAWLERYGAKSELTFEAAPRVGDILSTDASGQIELRLGTDAILQINSDSEVAIGLDQSSSVKGRPELHVRKGRACIKYMAVSEIESGLRLVLGDSVFGEINIRGDVCTLRRDGMSALKLRSGSVRITHVLDRNIVVLSSIGTEFYAEDNGKLRLISPGVDALTSSAIERPFAVDPPAPEDEAVEPADEGAKVTASDAGAGDDAAGASEVFSVYLFSSRSANVADDVNQRFLNAGFESRVIKISDGTEDRYRVAVPGFPSRQAAQKFADTVVGRHGITDTWIGRDVR